MDREAVLCIFNDWVLTWKVFPDEFIEKLGTDDALDEIRDLILRIRKALETTLFVWVNIVQKEGVLRMDVLALNGEPELWFDINWEITDVWLQ